jgi:hypothetical protein
LFAATINELLQQNRHFCDMPKPKNASAFLSVCDLTHPTATAMARGAPVDSKPVETYARGRIMPGAA